MQDERIHNSPVLTFREAERKALVDAISYCHGTLGICTQKTLGELLGVDRHVIKRRLRKYQLDYDKIVPFVRPSSWS